LILRLPPAALDSRARLTAGTAWRVTVQARRAGDGRRSAYYGTADATALFVMLLGELQRWGGHDAEVRALLPHADRALEWIERYGDADGDGFVEYSRKTSRGLINQGWKDSPDSINFAGGQIAEPPIALAEVQGYTYAAYRARARLAAAPRDTAGAGHWDAKAGRIKEALNDAYWLADRGWFAVAGYAPGHELPENRAERLYPGRCGRTDDDDNGPDCRADTGREAGQIPAGRPVS
jgi:glycogen debranching enzyme